MFSTQGKAGPASNRVSVEGWVVDRWPSMLQDPSDQDLTVKAEDGQCTVDSTMLTLASPAVKAALASAMKPATLLSDKRPQRGARRQAGYVDAEAFIERHRLDDRAARRVHECDGIATVT